MFPLTFHNVHLLYLWTQFVIPIFYFNQIFSFVSWDLTYLCYNYHWLQMTVVLLELMKEHVWFHHNGNPKYEED